MDDGGPGDRTFGNTRAARGPNKRLPALDKPSASHKMTAPKYQEFDASQIPVEETSAGGTARVIAGETDSGLKGPVLNELTEPLYLDIILKPDKSFKQAVPEGHNVAIFVIAGKASVEDVEVQPEQLGIFSDGTDVEISAGPDGARFLLIAEKPSTNRLHVAARLS